MLFEVMNLNPMLFITKSIANQFTVSEINASLESNYVIVKNFEVKLLLNSSKGF